MTRRLLGSVLLGQLAIGCGTPVSLVESDIGFAADDVSTDPGPLDGSGANDNQKTCLSAAGAACPVEAPRCLPDARGRFSCAEAGPGELGDTCGVRGVDDCGTELLCVNEGAAVSDWRCRTRCLETADCDEGAICRPIIVAEEVSLGVCVKE
jgi:hypothetical protein